MLVYLAGPIDQAHGATLLKRLYLAVQQTLTSEGHSTFRPQKAYQLGLTNGLPNPEDLVRFDDVNRAAIRSADAVVALLPPGVPTLGTPTEVEYALSLNKPVNLVSTRTLFSASVQLNSWLARGATGSVVDEHDGRLLSVEPWAQRLGSLPRPAELPHSVPPLLVTGESHNLQVGKYEGDAGLDLAINRDVNVGPAGTLGDRQLVTTGVHVAVPVGYFGLITGRSSTYAKHRIRVNQGVIDAGYRGELFVSLTNESDVGWTFEKGTRLAQFILLPTFQGGLHVVPELPESTRGEAGFGSSGR